MGSVSPLRNIIVGRGSGYSAGEVAGLPGPEAQALADAGAPVFV